MSVQVQLFSTLTFQVHQIDVSLGFGKLGLWHRVWTQCGNVCRLIWAPDRDLTCNFSSTCTLATCPGTEDRWEEELTLVKYEMEWTARFFGYRANQWQKRFLQADLQSGPKAYVAQQAAQWSQMASNAHQLFEKVNGDYQPAVI